MKWDCGPTWAEKKAALEQWHDFFALWPRRVGPHDCRWLEVIERRGIDGRECWFWEFRAKQ